MRLVDCRTLRLPTSPTKFVLFDKSLHRPTAEDQTETQNRSRNFVSPLQHSEKFVLNVEVETEVATPVQYVYVYIYMYIYIHIYLCVYIYVYIYFI